MESEVWFPMKAAEPIFCNLYFSKLNRPYNSRDRSTKVPHDNTMPWDLASYLVGQASLVLTILLLQLPKCCNYTCAPPPWLKAIQVQWAMVWKSDAYHVPAVSLATPHAKHVWALSITVFPAHFGHDTNTGKSSKLHRNTLEKYIWGTVGRRVWTWVQNSLLCK